MPVASIARPVAASRLQGALARGFSVGPSFARLRAGFVLGLSLLSVGCGALYPEITTPVRLPSDEQSLEPAPPRDLVFIRFERAEIPKRTRDGREWDEDGLPDPVAKLVIDEQTILETEPQPDTLSPAWPEQPVSNYSLQRGSDARVELWDSDSLHSQSICFERLGDLLQRVQAQPVEVRCDGGARVFLMIAPARGMLGLGFSYELHGETIVISRLYREGPAARAGLRAADELVEIAEVPVSSMQEGEAQSLINKHARTGVVLRTRSGKTITVKEGPIYPREGEPRGPLDGKSRGAP